MTGAGWVPLLFASNRRQSRAGQATRAYRNRRPLSARASHARAAPALRGAGATGRTRRAVATRA